MKPTSFADQAALLVQAGRGGKGCRSFYQDLWTRHPIPDGGDGGRGGDVLVRANPQLTTLLDFQAKRHFRAGPGGNASSKKKHGARGADCFIEVPLGTLLWDADTGDLIRELLEPSEQVVAARGGAGGVGNASRERSQATSWGRGRDLRHLKDPTILDGAPGEERRLRLELKMIADIGIIGLPNAGKSTLIAQISQARPKIAAFPFTTLHPVLGAVKLSSGNSVVAVDVPGLIEGAHQGKGLGLEFLRHIERTRLLVHLIDMAAVDGRDPVQDIKTLNKELKAYHPSVVAAARGGRTTSDLRVVAAARGGRTTSDLQVVAAARGGRTTCNLRVAAKPQIVVANKMDEPAARKNLIRFRKKIKGAILPISAKTGDGVPKLLDRISIVIARPERPKQSHKRIASSALRPPRNDRMKDL